MKHISKNHLVMRANRFLFIMVMTLCLGCGGNFVVQPSAAPDDQTGVVQTLLELLQKLDRINLTVEDNETSIKDIRAFRTPAGYRIQLRYTEFGHSLAEALRVARDPELKRRLIEMAQWSREPKVRAEAIITLATLGDPTHKKYFKEAVLDSKVGIRFAAIEALQIWGHEEAPALIHVAADRDWSPFLKMFAAQALLSLDDQSGLPILWEGLNHKSWVVRAMAARYLGDYADPKDYEKIISYLNREQKNQYVIAELSIAALKLISKKGEKISYSPISKGWQDHDEVKFTIGKDGVIELEPLVIVPPRLRIPKSHQIASRINNELLRLLKDKVSADLDPIEASDPIKSELDDYLTSTGFALYLRYSNLSYLLIEALAGSSDPLIRSELEGLARNSTNDLVRATSIVSLAYNRDPRDTFVIQSALEDKSATVRLGAMEAIEIGRFEEILPSLITVLTSDKSPALRVYAMQVLAKFGNPSGRHGMISEINNPDWPARAMAYWYLGRYGQQSDYTLILSRMGTEQNPWVKAEIVLAALRLSPL